MKSYPFKCVRIKYHDMVAKADGYARQMTNKITERYKVPVGPRQPKNLGGWATMYSSLPNNGPHICNHLYFTIIW